MPDGDIRDAVQTNLSGADDSVENSHLYLISCWVGMVVKYYEIQFVHYVILISNSTMVFMRKYAFTHIFFYLCVFLLTAEND